MATLVNDELDDILDNIKQFKTEIQDAFYEQYKGAYTLTQSINFKGETADAYKNYISTVSINFMNAFLNVSEEITETLEEIKNEFLAYEASESGIVDEVTLEDIALELKTKKGDYESLLSEIEAVTSRANEYISTITLSSGAVTDDYDIIIRDVSDIQEELLNTDERALEKAENLYTRIEEMYNNIERIANNYYDGVKIDYSKVGSVAQQEWYQAESSETLDKLLESDPFSYITGTKSVREDQVAMGYSSDIYAYMGGRFFGAEGVAGWNNGVGTASGNFSLFSLNADGQFTDWARLNVTGNVLGGNGEAKIGWSDNYKGLSLEGEFALAKMKSSIVLGTENFNGTVDFVAEAGRVSGYCVAEYEDKNDFDIGLGGSATAGRYEVSAGLSFLEVESTSVNADGTTDTVSLFKFDPGISAGESVGAGVRLTSKNVYDGDFVNVNVTSFSLNAEVLLGVKLDVNFPTLSLDWPF